MSYEHEFSSLRNLPLNGLIAFEAVMRLGNFRRAAEELAITHSAVSHRVRQLEERLGRSLFIRHGNRVSPTTEGHEYYEAAIAVLGALRYADDDMDLRERRLVRIAVMPMFGMVWLIPRLRQFSLLYPSPRFEIETIRANDTPRPSDVDVIIHYGALPVLGAASVEVLSDSLYAVGAPDFVGRHGPFRTLNDFLRLPLLRYSLLTWPTWLHSAFGQAVEPQGSYFDDAMTVLEAVRKGLGLTVITGVASRALLDSGELVLAHPHGAHGRNYHVTLTDAGSIKPAASTFFHWLVKA